MLSNLSLNMPEDFSDHEPSSPLNSIPNASGQAALSSNLSDLTDLPFSGNETSALLRRTRSFPASYFKQLEDLRNKGRTFSQNVIRSRALAVEKSVAQNPDYFPWDIVEAACDVGLYSALIPKAYGGGGYLSLHMGMMSEELAAGCAGLATTIGVHSGALSCGLISADAYLLETKVRDVAVQEKKGKPVLWGGAVTEPAAGTDIWDESFIHKGSPASFARKVAGGYRLTGRKCFISNGSVADYVVIAAGTDKSDIAGSWSTFLVPANTQGFSVGRVERKLGQKSSPTTELIFDDVFLPNDALIGLEGQGSRYVSIYLAGSRGPVGAIGVGCARRALECLIEWAHEKKHRGTRLIDQQWIQMEIARMSRDIMAARSAYVAAALAVDEIFLDLLGNPMVKTAMNLMPSFFAQSSVGKQLLQSDFVRKMMWRLLNQSAAEQTLAHTATLATSAKIIGSDTGVNVCGAVMRIMGHDAMSPRWPVDKSYRDAKLTQIYEGTNQANAITQFKGQATLSPTRFDAEIPSAPVHTNFKEAV